MADRSIKPIEPLSAAAGCLSFRSTARYGLVEPEAFLERPRRVVRRVVRINGRNGVIERLGFGRA